ncbi:hypothetical protein DSO57_1023972 [Entomophthora muscae]|uniref:Uncharacterized protein n=1 Tax=Entomophthora muscae TaxID=34485 RepID=A0ACC2S4U6_9FUNG|nr:hypothetical protein DSO57_1023972 [Entomophthora muscae]
MKKCLKLESDPIDSALGDLKSLVEEVEALDLKRQQFQKQIKMYTEPSHIECDTLYLEYMNEVRIHDEAHMSKSNKENLTPEDDPSERLRQLNQAIDELTQENFELQKKLGSSRS